MPYSSRREDHGQVITISSPDTMYGTFQVGVRRLAARSVIPALPNSGKSRDAQEMPDQVARPRTTEWPKCPDQGALLPIGPASGRALSVREIACAASSTAREMYPKGWAGQPLIMSDRPAKPLLTDLTKH